MGGDQDTLHYKGMDALVLLGLVLTVERVSETHGDRVVLAAVIIRVWRGAAASVAAAALVRRGRQSTAIEWVRAAPVGCVPHCSHSVPAGMPVTVTGEG